MKTACIARTRTATFSFAAVLLVASVCAVSASDDAQAYREDRADAQKMYESARDACAASSGDRKDVCIAEARLRRSEALALAEARYKGTAKAAYEASIVSLEAEYRAAAERCDARAGPDREACVAEARALRALAREDAQVAFDALTDRDAASRHAPGSQHGAPLERCDPVRRDAKHDCLRRVHTSYRR